MKREAGFTLAELMLVLAVIGLLLSVVAPRLAGRGEEARRQAARLQVESLVAAVDAFDLDCGRPPGPDEGLEALRSRPPDTPNWRGPYLRRALPQDPWGRAYLYRHPGLNGPDAEIFSVGPDGREGTDDDVASW